MPMESGIELAGWVQEHHPVVPVILMSAEPDLTAALAALNVGIVAFLRKPVGLGELAMAVRRAADERGMRLAARAHAHESEVEQRDWRRRQALFARGLQQLRLLYQPLHRLWSNRNEAIEAVVDVPDLGLGGAHTLYDLAAELGRQTDLEMAIRGQLAQDIARRDDWSSVFLDVQSCQLLGGFLGTSKDPLLPFADRIVLDLATDLRLPDTPQAREGIGALRRAGFRLSAHDLAAAVPFPARLFELAARVRSHHAFDPHRTFRVPVAAALPALPGGPGAAR